MHRLSSIAAILFCALSARAADVRLTDRKPIAGLGETRSAVLQVKSNEVVTVYPARGPGGVPEIEVFVYSDKKVLLAKDTEEEKDKFRWLAPAAMSIYVLARNVSEVSGTLVVEVEQARPDKGQARGVIPETAVMSVYYATNRTPTPGATEPYGTDPAAGGSVSYGLCRVSIPRDHRMGELEGPAIWKLEFRPVAGKHIALVGSPLVAGKDEFFEAIRRQVSASKGKQALVFVHGFNTTFTGAARRTAQLSYDLGFDGVAAFYSWPSHGALSPIGYNADVRNADVSVANFKQFLDDLSSKTRATTIHIIAHSMGNRVLSRAMSEMALAKSRVHFRRVVLMAPDVDAGLFQQLAAQMKGMADDITLYASSRDLALKASSVYASYARAGQGGSDILVLPGLTTIDASYADTSLLGALHQYYGDSRTVMSDVFALMQGRQPDQRFGLKRATKAGAPYWVFAP